MEGMVTLVGAGPGGSGLLTLAGLEALRQAEAVVYDHLVSEDILARIPETAERINAGKESARHAIPQPEINALLVRLAGAGKRVVRLKGGDCFLFGRGGEECEFLREHGVPFRVIPGVTSALAAPAFAGIPATHRDFCSSVHIVTAHAQKNAPLKIDYESLVKLRGTLVFLMGAATLPVICAGLLEAGMDPGTPAAVIENGARPQQRKVVAALAELPACAREQAVKSPAVIVVGGVCALSDRLDWYTALPLHGKTVVVTRPKGRAGTLSGKLRETGAEVVECPCIETVLKEDLSAFEQALGDACRWAVFTSPAGVHLTVQALRKLGLDLRALYGKKLAAVGRGTADALAEYGLAADLVPQQFDSTHLSEALADALPPDTGILLLRGALGGGDLPARLRANGYRVVDIPIYDTLLDTAPRERLQGRLDAGTVDAAVFTSASTVRGFVEMAGGRDLSALPAICIGAQTAKQAADAGMPVFVAKSATVDSLVACTMDALLPA